MPEKCVVASTGHHKVLVPRLASQFNVTARQCWRCLSIVFTAKKSTVQSVVFNVNYDLSLFSVLSWLVTHTLWTPCALALFHKTEVQKSCFDCSDFQPFTTVWKIGSMSTQKAADTTQGFEVCAHSENDLLKFKERRRM